jgi:hypothetical protein
VPLLPVLPISVPVDTEPAETATLLRWAYSD